MGGIRDSHDEKMDQLEDLWKCITNVSFPKKPSEVAELLKKNKAALQSGLSRYSRLSKKEATTLTSDDIFTVLSKKAKKDDSKEDLTDQALLLASVIHTLYLDIPSATEVVENAAAADNRRVSSLYAMRVDPATEIVLKQFYRERRLVIAILRYVYETSRSLDSANSHPYHALFVDVVDRLRESDEFYTSLLREYEMALSLLRDYAENPLQSLDNAWLSLQLQDLRDLCLLLFDISGQIPKNHRSLELIIKPLLTSGQFLQKFPISAEATRAALQTELLLQVNLALTAFSFHYISIGVPIFLRDDRSGRYLDESLPTGSSLAIASLPSILWYAGRLESTSSHEKSAENLNQTLKNFDPFSILTTLLRSDIFYRDSMDVLASVAFEFGEQFLRLIGTDNVAPMSESLFSLAAEIYKHPKEARRFWQRWSEGAGSDLGFHWGRVLADARDGCPKTLMHLVAFATGLLDGLPANGPEVTQFNQILWNLDSFTEERGSDLVDKSITLIKEEARGISVVRTDNKRLPYGSDAIVIPGDTFGWMVIRDLTLEFKWILNSDSSRYSIWTLCALQLQQNLARWKEDVAAVYSSTLQICRFFGAAVRADRNSGKDLQSVLQYLARTLGSLILAAENAEKPVMGQLHELVQSVLEVCHLEIPVLGNQLVNDLNLLVPIMPKTVHRTTADFEWIRNGDLTWFSKLWQTLCQGSEQKSLTKTFSALASVLHSSIQAEDGSLSNDALLQQSNIFLLNIGLQYLAQLEDPSDGKMLVQYIVGLLTNESAAGQAGPNLFTIACDCLYEGPAGQALIELLNRGNRLLNHFLRNDDPKALHDVTEGKEIQFVRLVLEAVSRLLDLLPVRQGHHHVTSFERALLTTEKTKQMESITTVNTRDTVHRHSVQQLMRFVLNAKDAKIVSFSVRALSRLIVLQQPSLMSVGKDDADEFILSVFRLLQNSPHSYVIEDLWRLLALCDSKQPRLLDLFINLKYISDNKQYEQDIETFPSLLDVALETISSSDTKDVQGAALAFCLELFTSKNDYVDHLSLNERFWKALFRVLEDVPDGSIPWEKKLPAAYALDLISHQIHSQSADGTLFSEDMIDSQWTPYITEQLPKIFFHLNKDVPRLLHSYEEEADAIEVLTRFFSSWTGMNLRVFRKEQLKDVVLQETRRNAVRTMFVLLNRSLLASTGGSFVQAVSSSLRDMLHSWRADLDTQFFASLFHIVSEFTTLVCGRLERTTWNDNARHSILAVVLQILDIVVDGKNAEDHLPANRLRQVFEAAVDVVSYSALEWNVRDEGQDIKGVMLSYAVGVMKLCIRLVAENSQEFGMENVKNILQKNCVYEILLTKTVHLVTAGRLPLVTQRFLNLFLLLSETQEGASTLNQAGFAGSLAFPLAASIDTFKELLVERVLQDVTMKDLASSKERLSQAQDVFEVYVTGLAVQLNVLRKQKLRTEETVRFVGAQIGCMPDVLEALRTTPTMFTFRLAELLTRLMAEASKLTMSLVLKQACTKDAPLIFHYMCGQIVKRADKLKDDVKNAETPTMELILSAAISSLEVLNASNPGISALLTEEEHLTSASSAKVVVDFNFASPASLGLSPALSFGSLFHVTKTIIEVLSKLEAASLYKEIYEEPDKQNRLTASGKLLDVLERGCFYFMYQAVAFALELTDLYGDRWHETLREVSNEIEDLRHVLHNFLSNLEEIGESETPGPSSTRPKPLLSLLVDDMISYRSFYEDLRTDNGEGHSYSLFSTPRGDRKRVTFAL